MCKVKRRLESVASRELGLVDIHFEWNHDHPWIVGREPTTGIKIKQSFSSTARDAGCEIANTIANLRRKVAAVTGVRRRLNQQRKAAKPKCCAPQHAATLRALPIPLLSAALAPLTEAEKFALVDRLWLHGRE